MATIKQLFDLKGKTALITGASRGLGFQIAQALGEQGANLILAARNQNGLVRAADLLANNEYSVRILPIDLDCDEEIHKFAQQACSFFGSVDILINNAGRAEIEPAQSITMESWDRIMRLNVRNLFALTQAIANLSMIPRRYGRIVNIASIAAQSGSVFQNVATCAYSASKGGLVSLTKALAGEWGKYGITVNALIPGFFVTKLTQGMLSQDFVKRINAITPLQKLGDEDDLKGSVLLLATDAGKHITGHTLTVDGGLTAVYGNAE